MSEGEGSIRITRALVSVSDKRGLDALAKALHERDIEILSTGGTATAIAEAGVPVTSVDDVTGFPEILGGRVKTLHPKIHGGILAKRDDDTHGAQMREHGIEGIDLVVINLYPFERTVAREGVTRDDAVENIDIGGPAMLRAAAKNHEHVCVVCEPLRYEALIEELRASDGRVSRETRRACALETFRRTSAYDAAIAAYLATQQPGDPTPLPERLSVDLRLVQPLRYGENPHQQAGVYRDAHTEPAEGALVGATQHHGKELSYNNLLDASAAIGLARDLARISPDRACAAVIKHTNPCGAAVANDARRAVDLAMKGDPLAAFGGILALAGTFDSPSAERLAREDVFLEVVLAHAFEESALRILSERWKNVRLLSLGERPMHEGVRVRSISGGVLVQQPDEGVPITAGWTHAAGPEPGAETLRQAGIVWTFAKHLTSNAIAIGGDASHEGVTLFGGGAGQMDRVASCRNAIQKAGKRAKGAIAASDAFFPFPDGPGLLIDAGVSVIVHPGGSKRDGETFDLCNARGVTCLTTGVRHFRH